MSRSGKTRIDERDTMFSRMLLEEGSEHFAAYYSAHPEKRLVDDRFRARPGLLADAAAASDPVLFAAACAGFDTVEPLRGAVDGDVAGERVEVEAAAITRFLERWIYKLGAHSVGFTELRPEHVYSHVGRGEEYGRPVKLGHRFAVAFTVEMDHDLVMHAPMAPTTMSSARGYVESGAIAVQVAAFLRRLGHAARAHIDGNYRVICPLVGRDAGLGEIGRNGLLITPRLGPRVRIGVVTTELALVPAARRVDPSVEDLCRMCDRCATMCPVRAIPAGEAAPTDGAPRWKISADRCFDYWCRIGTDCARCVAVCPQSHPDRPVHRLVRWGVRRSRRFRRLALRGEKLVYGRWPAPARLPDWMRVEARRPR